MSAPAPGPRVRRLTPAGSGGVAVLEVVGAGALARVASLLVRPPRRGALVLARLVEGGELLDEALVWAESDERVELHLHGGPAVVARVRASLGAPRDEPEAEAEPRASLEELAWAALADVPGEAAARVLLDQARGALRAELALLARELDEEPEAGRGRARELARRARAARPLWRPPSVVLVGPVNAGKSTLFNALVGEERALVSDERGTTRDAVRARAGLAGIVVELVDTAGERPLRPDGDPFAPVEQAGQRLAAGLAERAELVLRLVPARELLAEPALPKEPKGPREVLLASRADELAGPDVPACPLLSARRDPAGARALVGAILRSRLALGREPWVPGRAVPFTVLQEGVLAALAGEPPEGGPDSEEARRLLAAWLAAGPPPTAGSAGLEPPSAL